MIAMLLRRLAWVLLACAVLLSAIERFDPRPTPLLVQADYQRCVTLRPGPLVPRSTGTNLYPRRSDTA